MNAEACRACAGPQRTFGPGVAIAADRAGQRAGFDVSATLRGQTSAFRVYYDDDFGSTVGASLADAVLARCDADYQAVADIFGTVVPPLPMTAIVSTWNHAQGGYHYGCLGTEIYVAGQQPTGEGAPALALAVLVAEEVEVFQAAQNLGWDCSKTNGEGLSRVLAEELYPGVLDGFNTAGYWLDNGRPDYITDNHGTDRDRLSNGCSVLFLYYLRYILGYEWPLIVQTGGATLEETYRRLTGSPGAYSALRDCVDGFFPPGSPSGLVVDNPFPVFDFYAAGSMM
jgi:hypothetical protein